MTTLQGSNGADHSASLTAEEHGPNTDIIKNAIPAWLIKATPERRAALRATSLEVPPWYANASTEQRQEMKRLTEASLSSQNALDTIMSRVDELKAFAEPLLIKALAEQYNVHLDVKTTFLRLNKPLALGAFNVKVSTFEVMTLSLLDAALHNFEAFECKALAFDASSGFGIKANPGASFEPIVTPLTVERFTTLCRTLDIGQKYQDHLTSILKPDEPGAEAVLSTTYIACQKAALHSAANIALVKKDIDQNDYKIILSAIAGDQKIMNGNTPVWFWEPRVMGRRLTGCLAFSTIKKYTYGIDEIILYIPHDPEHPLKKYRDVKAMEEQWTRRLLAPDTSAENIDGRPTRYQQFLSQFIDYKDRPDFFNRFTQKVADAPADPLAVVRPPIVSDFVLPIVAGSWGSLLLPNELPPAKTAPREPLTELDMRVSYGSREGLWAENGDLWAQCYQRSRDKLFSDARSQAVPTADADAKTRADRIAHLLEGAMALLNGVSMFVPVLGEVMLAVMAGQLMYETLEGAVEWGEGDREAAWAHLIDVAENLALMGVMAVGGRVLKGVKASPFVDSLKPVRLPDGTTRLWKPDLTPYQAKVRLPVGSVPNELGLHAVAGQDVLPLADQLYVVKQDPLSGERRIQHPDRPDAYTPVVEDNGAGAWAHEGEEPLAWEGPTLMRRLGYSTNAFSDSQLEQIRLTSGVEHDQLRRTHVDQEPPSALLADSLTRFRIDQDIETFKKQISSDDRYEFSKADPRLQLQIIRAQGLLPDTPPLRVMDRHSNVFWEDPLPSDASSRRVDIVLTDQELARGELRDVLLEVLEMEGVDLTHVSGGPGSSIGSRAAALRKEIAHAANNRKTTLFESLYRAQDTTTNPAEQRIRYFFPELPAVVARRIVEGMSAEQLSEIGKPGPLPQSIYEQARWCQQEVRVARAYEGFYLDASARLDSERLALHSLENLPGWPTGIRVELREYSATGRLLDSIGGEDASVRKVVVFGENGLYGEQPSADIYWAVLQALSPDEHVSLGFTAQEASRLKQAVRQRPMNREAFRTALLKHRELRPSFAPGVKLLGGAGYSLPTRQEIASFFRANRARVRKLYPDFKDTDIEAFVQSLGADPRDSLRRLEAEYVTLKRELKSWVHEHRSPDTQRGTTAHTEVANLLKRCWRRQTAARLRIDSDVELPALSASFSHVEALELKGPWFKETPDSFLKGFDNLKRLTISRGRTRLTFVPDIIGQMHGLTHLDLSVNAIVLTEHSASMLGGLSTLEVLKLHFNPLGRLPDFSAMPRLREVDLSWTGIDQWPEGLRNQPGLRSVDLRDNQLTQVPEAFLSPPEDQVEAVGKVNRVTLLEGNPFSRASALRLWDYRQQLLQARPELWESGLEGAFEVNPPLYRRYRQLYPDTTFGQTEAFFRGFASEGAIESLVSGREAEQARLDSQLSEWAYSGEQQGRYVHVNNRANRNFRDHRYLAAERIRRCWQLRTPQVLARDGSPIGIELDLSGLGLPNLPELDADFSHVGSLNLSNMGLTVTPEAFLRRNRGVRWLDLSGNRLTEVPQALGEMEGLTRLFLQHNRIRLTPETAQVLAGRTTLRALSLFDNPLGITPDFSQMVDLRSLSLGSTGIETWPTGLAEQPALDVIDLSHNRLVTIPDSVIAPPAEHLEQAARLNNVTHIQGNPFSTQAQRQLDEYWARLVRERPYLWAELRQQPRVFEYQAPGVPGAGQGGAAGVAADGQAALQRWILGLPADQAALRKTQWDKLYSLEESTLFFKVLADLEPAGAGAMDLQQRVWEVIDSLSEPNAESEQLRKDMFEWAARPACCDRAALSFSNLEVMAMVYRAGRLAQEGQQGAVLLKLSRGLFRLDNVERIALADIGRRTAAINATEGLTSAQKAQRIALLEEVEIKLAYRFGLKDRLGLPGQPQRVRFIRLGDVSSEMLDSAQAQVLALDNSPEEIQALVERGFWKRYLASKYQAQFEARQAPYLERQLSLYQAHAAQELSQAAYEQKSLDLDAQLQIEEAALVQELTHQELAQTPF
ncbi:NEL-type E3 ubiquitin ligase domain-containing protein [Pseudomonas sp. NPDC098740]|uniref:NEL-type E3 ubiquitin ligase domain-containing protein n=1 Tax=Pseudomonas sp. NPDC098740 TaxID=3364486 RepID=UPI00383B19C9